MSNEDIVVYVVWALSALCAFGLIGLALYSGMRDQNPASLLFWRRVKLGSALLGIVGLALLVISFDQLIHDNIRNQGREYSADRFLEAKLILAHQLAIFCSQTSPEAKTACGEIRNVD